MKKKITCGLMVFATLTALLAGCGKQEEELTEYDSSKESIYIHSDGRIDATTLGTFDQDYYDIDEYEAFVQAKVDDYNAANPVSAEEDGTDVLPVSVTKISLEDSLVTMKLSYGSADSYLGFNREYQNMSADTYFEICYTGDEDASMDGVSFVSAEDGAAVDSDKALEVYAKESKKTNFVGLNFSTELTTDGTILYVSDSDCIEITGKNTATVTTDGAPVYIIYK